MSRRLTNDILLTAALVAAVAVSFLSSYYGWSGEIDAWFVLSLASGVVFSVMATVSAILCVRRYYSDLGLKVPLIVVTRDEFVREPPIRGKGRV